MMGVGVVGLECPSPTVSSGWTRPSFDGLLGDTLVPTHLSVTVGMYYLTVDHIKNLFWYKTVTGSLDFTEYGKLSR